MSIQSLQLGGEIVRRAHAKGHNVSNLSLQKLAYFCHGWNLALFNKPLVTEQFEAWKFGPVLPSLYHSFKPFGSSAIPANHTFLETIPRIDGESLEASLIDRIVDVYGGFSSFQLVELSHRADGPWYPVYHDDSTVNGEIGNDKIREYFAGLSNRKP
ncbi:Panacea domain-containing protein [Achromobacter xylosoxidans]|uniref:Panacea domain-containing protein n=1 Tax=Alcaligenes xylosoxydans xylosoxydans TaxID=85698 RepID=UPI003D2D545A